MRRRAGLPRAFSLLEVVLVLGIIAVVAGLAAPRFAGAAMRYHLDLAARRMVSDLSLAQSWARTSGQRQTVAFDVAAGSYRMTGVRTLDNRSTDYRVNLAGAPYPVTLVSANLGGDPNVTFDAYGAPDSGGTVVIRANGRDKTITLNAYTGKAAVQ